MQAADTVLNSMKRFYGGEQMKPLFFAKSNALRVIKERGGVMSRPYEMQEIVKTSEYGIRGSVGLTDSSGNLAARNTTRLDSRFLLKAKEVWFSLDEPGNLILGRQPRLLANHIVKDVKNLGRAVNRFMNRMLWGDGTGKLADVLVGQSNHATTGWFYVGVSDCGAFPQGSKVDIYNAAGTRVCEGGTIRGSDIRTGPGYIVVEKTGMTGVNAGGAVYVQNACGATTSDREYNFYGIPHYISQSGWLLSAAEGGFDRSDEQYVNYRAAECDASASTRPIYEQIEDLLAELNLSGDAGSEMYMVKTTAGAQWARKFFSWIWTSPRVKPAISRSLRQGNQNFNQAQIVDLGFVVDTGMGAPIVEDNDCPQTVDGSLEQGTVTVKGTATVMNARNWEMYEDEPTWAGGDAGAGLFKRISGSSMYEAAGLFETQAWDADPASEGKVTNIDVSSVPRARSRVGTQS